MEIQSGTDLKNILESAQYGQIDRLKKASQPQSKDELKKAADDFEAVFFNQLLTSMESTIDRSDLFGDGKFDETYRSLYYQEISKVMAYTINGPNTLGDQIYKQLEQLVDS